MPANSKVLVIDDERSMRDLLKMGLEEQGYTIRCSADGRGLQETIAEWQPDAVVHFAEQRAAPFSMKSSWHKRYTVENNVNATHNVLAAIVESGLFGMRRHEWSARDLLSVRVQSERTKDADGDTRWTIALIVQPKEGETYRLLSYRAKAELEWIATMVREALRLRPAET